MRERVGICVRKIACYHSVREMDVEGSGQSCGVPQRGAEIGDRI